MLKRPPRSPSLWLAAYLADERPMHNTPAPLNDSKAAVNADDKRGMVMLQNCKATHQTFALKSSADFKAKIISNTLEGLELDINGKLTWFRLIGSFNAYNLLGVLGVAVLIGEDEDEVLTALSAIRGAKGRFDRIAIGGIVAIVDYAHTPDALDNVLKTISITQCQVTQNNIEMRYLDLFE